MPGRRLAYADRRQISAGLARGLSYAEIARRIDRPTSTVTREVTRNGGPGSYRAEPAQRATGQRARRRAPHPETRHPDPAEQYDAISVLATELSTRLMRMGLPRMASRVFAWLCVADADSVTAAELAAALRVTPASISKAVGYLTDVGLLLRERDGRRDRYRIGDHVWMRVGLINSNTDQAFIAAARRGAAALGADTPAGARLAELAWSLGELYRTHPCPECGTPLTIPDLFGVNAGIVAAAPDGPAR
ncbi:helix-turn-helix domain-containing protein [Nocardia arthritidis]|uniref:Helix-turn-helix domain-containing protein n=1 Tax=Nocardia arthritidis TaxID=228602 RepID=A0A6G9YIH1_9NOCA|nr:helix-turn-helix domain-containing protein [Nocardia arthritidis]QIS12984.1 helix-turn-helix domain-containing protein [Nocardia arthritidis]